MLATIWMWTQEWSDMSRRSALTCCMYHHACRRRSALAAFSRASRRRLPRVGARISSFGNVHRGYPTSDGHRDPLFDGHGRRISDLRVSVTDRCNFRCQYCMPADGLPWLERAEMLSFEEIERLVRVLAQMGVTDLRLTGGEPLVRREFPQPGGDARARARHRGPVADHQRLPARARRRRARRGGHHARQRVDRLAPARPLLPAHPARLPAAGAARARGDRRATSASGRSRSTRSRCAGSPRRRRSRSPSSPAPRASRCASSSSCRSTATTPGAPTRC